MRRAIAPAPDVGPWRRETRAALRSSWPTSDVPFDDPSEDAMQLRRLAAALILSAIQCSADPKHLRWLYPSKDAEAVNRYRDRDREWIETDRRGCRMRGYRMSTYVECCEVLGIDHHALREMIRRHGWLDGTAKFDVKKVADVLTPMVASG